jgi:hypothetical protein
MDATEKEEKLRKVPPDKTFSLVTRLSHHSGCPSAPPYLLRHFVPHIFPFRWGLEKASWLSLTNTVNGQRG